MDNLKSVLRFVVWRYMVVGGQVYPRKYRRPIGRRSYVRVSGDWLGVLWRSRRYLGRGSNGGNFHCLLDYRHHAISSRTTNKYGYSWLCGVAWILLLVARSFKHLNDDCQIHSDERHRDNNLACYRIIGVVCVCDDFNALQSGKFGANTACIYGQDFNRHGNLRQHLGVLLRPTRACHEPRRTGSNLGRLCRLDGGWWRCTLERTHTVVHLPIDCRDFVLLGHPRPHGFLTNQSLTPALQQVFVPLALARHVVFAFYALQHKTKS